MPYLAILLIISKVIAFFADTHIITLVCIEKKEVIMSKKLTYFVICCLLLLGLAFPVCAADAGLNFAQNGDDTDCNSVTLAWQYLAGGFVYTDYEHSLG
jgi:hypothetical protein